MKRALHYFASLSGLGFSFGFTSRFASPPIFFLAAMLFFAVGAGAQSTANYTFSTNSTGSLALDLNGNAVDMSTGTTQISGASVDQGVNASAINIGFDFWLNGNRYTQFNATTNGLVSLSSTSTSVSGSTYVVSGGTTTTPIISAFAADLGTGTSGKTHYKVVGTAPNRTLVIEFLNMTLYWTTSYTNDGTYQVRLYENTGVVEFVYGAMSITSSASGSDVTAGIGFATNTTTNNLIYVTTSSNTSSVTASFTDNPTYPAGAITNLNSAANGSRRVYSFTPPVPPAPTSLTFASITATGMTLNWTASSPTTNVLKYAVYNSSDGGTTYNFVNTVNVGTNTLAVTGLSPSTTYLWRVYAVSEGALSTALSGSQATSPPGTKTASTGLWSAAGTWTPSGVPTATDDVVIPNAVTVTVDVAAVCYSLTVGQGTSGTLTFEATTARTLTVGTNVTVAAGGIFQSAASGTVTTHTLSLPGNIVNNGTIDFSTNTNTAGANITFTGSGNSSVTGTGGTTDLYTLTMSKSTQSQVVDFNVSNFSVRGLSSSATGALLTSGSGTGTLKFSGTNTFSGSLWSAVGYSIPSTLGFWLNNANFTVQGLGGSPTMSGLLRISAGTYNVGTASGNAMSGATTSSFIIEGGTLNFTGRLNVTSAGAQFNMSAGTINVCTIGNASSATASFGFTSTTSVFTMTGGTINLVQRSTGTTILDYNVATTAPTITGGTLNIGTAATTTNFDFRIQGAIPNLVVNNTTNNKQALLSAAATVYLNITVNSGATLNCNGFGLSFFGSTVSNSGIILGTTTSSRFNFSGTGAQSYSGAGTFGTAAAPFDVIGLSNTGAGATLNNPIITLRVNLFRGTFINSSQITIGNAGASSGVVQVGGTAAVNAGSFDAAPTFNVGTGGLSLIYTTANAITTGFEIPSSRTIGSMTINNTNGVTLSGGNLTLSAGTTPTLTMTLGNLNIGANNLILGLNATTPGVLTYTAGFITMTSGVFTRFYPTTGLPIVASGTSIGYYPIASGANTRQVNVFFSSATALSVGGSISVGHVNTTGLTTISGFSDGGITVDKRSNANWVISQSGNTLTGTISLAIRADAVAVPNIVADIRLIRATDAVGTSANGSGSVANPVLNRTGLDLTMLANTFYFGASSTNLPSTYTAIASGNWGDNATWDLNSTPGAGDLVIIPSPYNVTVAGAATPYTCYNVTINSGGTLTANANTLTITNNLTNAGTVTNGGGTIAVTGTVTNSGTVSLSSSGTMTVTAASATGISNTGTFTISGGTMTLGPSGGGNRTFSNAGTLSVSSGTLNINGNLSHTFATGFNQSGGNINIDGNSGVLGTSVASGTAMFSMTAATGTVTGGTITIVDPNFNSTGKAVDYNVTTTSSLWGTGHTLRIGNGTSTDASLNTSGYILESYTSTGKLNYGNLQISGGAATNHHTSLGAWSIYVGGTLTIDASSELVNNSSSATPVFTGNIVNDGTMTSTVAVNLAATSGSLTVVNTNAQTISGSGTFRNLTASPTANFTSLTVNNSNASGITFSNANSLLSGSNTGTVSGTLTMTTGFINTGSNALILGISAASTGTLSYTAGGFASGSTFSRWWGTAIGGATITAGTTPTGTGAGVYPFAIGTPSSFIARNFYLNQTVASTTGGRIAVKYTDVAGTSAVSFLDVAYPVELRSNGSWDVTQTGITGTPTYTMAVNAQNLYAAANGNSRITLAAAASSGTHQNGTTYPNAQRITMPLANLVNTYYIGISNADFPFISVANGNWEDGTTWNRNPAVPTSTDVVTIATGTTVTVNAVAAAASAVTVNSGGTLTVSGNTLTTTTTLTNSGTVNVSGGTLTTTTSLTNNASSTITVSSGALNVTTTMSNSGTVSATGGTINITAASTTGITNAVSTGAFNVNGGTVNLGITDNTFCNRTFTNNGTLTVSSGTLNVYGNITNGSSAVFNQSGGNINIDGNAGGSAANSVASGTSLLQFNQLNSGINLTGGTLTIVDPHANTTASNVIGMNNATAGTQTSTSAHTTRFGNGTSTDAGGNAVGFSVDPWTGTAYLQLGSVVIAGPAGTNRNVTYAYQMAVTGNVTVNSGGVLSLIDATYGSLFFGGNLTVNTGGTFTSVVSLQTQTVLSNTSSSLTLTASTNAQTISGGGTFQNLAASPTANLTSFTVNNTNPSGVTLGVPLSVSGTLTMTSGLINTTSTNILRLGTATAAGTLTATPSATNMIVGPFARTFAASRTATGTYDNTTLFPVGKGSTYLPVNIDPTTTAGGAVIMSGEAFTSNSGTAGSGVSTLSTNRWEGLITSGGGYFTSSFIRLGDAAIVSTNKILQAPSAAGVYTGIPVSSTYAAGTPNTLITGSALTSANYTGYFAYGDLVNCTAPTSQPTSFVSSNLTTTSFTGSFTLASGPPSHYLVVRYPSGGSPTAPADFTSYAAAASLGTGTVVANVTSPTNTFNATGLTAGTTYDIYIYSYNNSGCFGPVYYTTGPLMGTVTTCAAATGVPGTPTSSVITASSFTATWTASSTPGVDYIIDVATDAGFTSFVSGYNGLNVGTGILTTNVTGLAGNTTYYVRVRAVISGCNSANSGTLTVTTELVVAPPYLEGFITTSTPSGWNISGWTIGSARGVTGNPGNNIYINLYSSVTTGTFRTVNVGPIVSGMFLTFDYKNSNYTSPYGAPGTGTGNFVVSVSTDFGQNYTTLATVGNSNTTAWQPFSQDLTAYAGQNVKIRIVGTWTSGDYDIAFDNIKIETPPVPTITSLGTTSGCPGSTLVINGTNLTGATPANVKIGGTAVASITSNTGTVLTVVTGAGTTGTVAVTIGANTATSTETYTFNPKPTASASSNTPVCVGTTLSLTGTTNIGTTYAWTGPNSFSSSIQNPSISSVTTVASGTYTFIATSSLGCASDPATTVVLVNSLPTGLAVTPATATISCGTVQAITASESALASAYTFSATSGTFTPLTGATDVNTIEADDVVSASLPIGFSFTFEGTSYTNVKASSNGWLSFNPLAGSVNSGTGNATSADVTNLPLLAPLWDDIDGRATGGSTASYLTTGTAPNRVFTFEWLNWEWDYLSTNPVISFQVKLYETTNRVEFVYRQESAAVNNTGLSPGASIGIMTSSTNYKMLDGTGATPNALNATFTTNLLTKPATGQIYRFDKPASTYLWAPTTRLYTDMAATIPYVAQNVATVYAKPTANTTYTVTATNAATCTATASSVITVTGNAALTLSNIFIEGYMLNATTMQPVMLNAVNAGGTVPGNPSPTSSQCDFITVELHNSTAPYALAYSQQVILSTTGTATVNFPCSVVSTSYYIVIKGRNILETWSKTPQMADFTYGYNFDAAADAYGDNMGVAFGVPVIYSGDIDAVPYGDGEVNLTDYTVWEVDNDLGAIGYYPTDLNGDGEVNLTDYTIWEANNDLGVLVNKP
ncbi:MAG: fibronectin type III domain-containing protein [Bacteroidota bacterium]